MWTMWTLPGKVLPSKVLALLLMSVQDLVRIVRGVTMPPMATIAALGEACKMSSLGFRSVVCPHAPLLKGKSPMHFGITRMKITWTMKFSSSYNVSLCFRTATIFFKKNNNMYFQGQDHDKLLLTHSLPTPLSTPYPLLTHSLPIPDSEV